MYLVKIHMVSGELLDRLLVMFTLTVGELLDDVAQSVSALGGAARLDCIVPPFSRRAASVGQRFRMQRASLVSSSFVALGTRLVELGASVLEEDADVITVTALLKDTARDRSRSRS